MAYLIALESAQWLDALVDIERTINGRDATERLVTRQKMSVPLMLDLHAWSIAQLAKLSCNHDLARTINHMLRR